MTLGMSPEIYNPLSEETNVAKSAAQLALDEFEEAVTARAVKGTLDPQGRAEVELRHIKAKDNIKKFLPGMMRR